MSDMNRFHTWREIHAQPGIWRGWGPALEAQAPELRDWIAGLGVDEIWLSGAGTSAYIGDIVADALPRFRGVPVRAVASTDLVAHPQSYLERGTRPLIINFGRSGNSAESVGVLAAIDALAPKTPCLNITCNRDGALAQRGRALVLPDATHDAGFAMTASFSTMTLSALALLSEEPDIAGTLDALGAQAQTVIAQAAALAVDLPNPDRIVFVGAGPLRFAAREAALKVMELTAGRVPALWDSTLGFRHGPKSFVTEGTVAAVMRSAADHPARYDADLVSELKSQYPGQTVLEIGGADLPFDSGVGDAWASVLHVIPAQVLGAVWSARLGLNVDDPFEGRGTLTRVVSGVRLHAPGPV